jgi:putative hemolysin
MRIMAIEPAPRAPLGLPRPNQPWLRGMVEGPMKFAERAIGLEQLEEFLRRIEQGDPSVPVFERALEVTGLRAEVADGEIERIPATGPVLVCANHPYGGADGLVLLATLLRRRDDVKVLGNDILARIPFLTDRSIFVDPFGGESAAARNARGLREAIEWLRAGHLLACFPAGEVSAVQWGQWKAVDPPWSTIPARLALRARARVVPIWFEGVNRGIFHAAGLVHPRLRTALLPSEFLARCGQKVELRVGRAVEASSVEPDAEELTRLIRGRCELLRRTPAAPPVVQSFGPVDPPRSTPDELAREFAALPAECLLASEGGYRVYAVGAPLIPRAMHEIGRLREIAFRGVGEGSGKGSDTDRFDANYAQIVLWNSEAREIAGGYRAGVVREVARDAGLDGLYTSTLFHYTPALLDALGDAVELGRSFVRPEYQRQVMPLSLLWRGIGVFMVRGGHRRLFGPVSISNDYSSMSKELIMEFLERHRLATPFAPMVRPRNPPERRSIPSWTARERAVATSGLGEVERLIDEIERGQRAVPVLLRQYLRLNARLLAFNVDPDFGEVIDALMLVDLAQIDDRILRHYAGYDGLAAVRARFSAP